jgi:hypothetical protein
MWVYLYKNSTENELSNAYIGIPNPASITLNKNSISLTTVWQTEQLTATIEPTVSDKTITWSSDDTTVATVNSTWLVTCVTPWECTITATTVNGLTATCSVTQSRLPSAYQEVEWIWSSGSQYIDTGMQFTNNTNSEFDLAFTSNRSGWTWIIWAQKQNVNTSWAIWISPSSFTYQQWSAFGDWNSTPTLDQKYHFNNSWSNIYIDDNLVKSIWSPWTFTTPVNWTIFKVNYQNSTWFYYLLSAKLYSCKIYESSTLVRDFVPCYRIADSVIWLYDVVNDTFYTNAGSWTFTKWSDV